MRFYTVQRRPTPAATDPDVVLVREGFSWLAFLVPLVWILWHRQWLGLLAYLLGLSLIAATATFFDEIGQFVLAFGYHFLVGVSANDWRRARLARQGYRLSRVIQAADLAEAEIKLFQAQPDAPAGAAPSDVPAQAPQRSLARRRSQAATPLAPWSP